jgi:hypothetical protein
VIAFATLLLGLAAGPQAIELLVGREVVAVELRHDGALCARLEAPPWRATCDLGEAPQPGRLLALAFDAAGRELGRAEQLVNLRRPPADLALLVDRDPESGALQLRLAARSVAAGPPRAVRVSVDGEELPASAGVAVPLPPLSLAEPHLIRAEAEWGSELRAQAEAVLGGTHGETLVSELTALAVDAAVAAAGARALAGIVRGGTRVLPVAAIERGPGELWVVGDPDVYLEFGRMHAGRRGARLPSSSVSPLAEMNAPPPRRSVQHPVGGLDWRFLGTLARDDQMRIVWPWPERRHAGGTPHDLFLPSPPATAADGGVPWTLYHARLPPPGEGPARLADAAAVAGLSLVALNRRRAVLLLPASDDRDGSQIAPTAARAYLERIGVPLHVWRLQERTGSGPDPWGERVHRIRRPAHLERALAELAAELEGQRIAWVEGAWLPHEIELARRGDEARSAQLAATGARPEPDDEALREPEAPLAARARASADPERRRRASAPLGTHAASALAAGVEILVHTNEAQRLPRFAAIVERFPGVWSARLGVPAPDLGGATVVFLPSDLAASVDGRTEALGARGHAGGGVAVVALDDDPDAVAALLVHELAHLASERTFLRPLPVWLEEGIAEWLARERLDDAGAPVAEALRGELRVEPDPVARTRRERRGRKPGGRTLELGGPLADVVRLADLAERRELPALAGWTALSWRELVAPHDRALHYALAESLVRFLLEPASPRAATVRALLTRAAGSGDLDLERELGEHLGDAGALDQELRRWMVARRDRLVDEASAVNPGGAPRRRARPGP